MLNNIYFVYVHVIFYNILIFLAFTPCVFARFVYNTFIGGDKQMQTHQLIRSRRLELGLTLKDVANALGTAESTISRYESGSIQNMGIDKIEAFSNVLSCSPQYLLGRSHFTTANDAKNYLINHKMIAAFNISKTLSFSDQTILEIADAIYKEKGDNKEEGW